MSVRLNLTGGKFFAFYQLTCRVMIYLNSILFRWTLTSGKIKTLRYLMLGSVLSVWLLVWCVVVFEYICLLSLRALTPMAGPSAALNRCVTCSVACPLSAAVSECYLCRGHLCRACLFRGVCLCAGCVQTLNPLLLRVPTMDLFFYNRSDELLEQTRWVVELADALTECHICRSVGFFVSCSGCHKPTCVGCHQTPETQCNWCCVEDFKLEFVGY